jgi:hypothetical protein
MMRPPHIHMPHIRLTFELVTGIIAAAALIFIISYLEITT